MRYKRLAYTALLSTIYSLPVAAKVDLQLGVTSAKITYTEPNVMQEKGELIGLLGGITFQQGYAFQTFELEYAKGEVDYVGSGTINDIPDEKLEVRGLFGRHFYVNRQVSLSPYLGLGYRYLEDDSSGMISSTSAAGYKREQVYVYLPIGITLEKKRSLFGLTLSTRLEYNYFISGVNHSHLGDIGGSYDNVTLKQHEGSGYRVSVGFSKVFKNGQSFTLQPFYRYWHIKDSDVTYDSRGLGWIEPDNNSKEIGIAFILKI